MLLPVLGSSPKNISAKGILDNMSTVKFPLRYLIAIVWGSFTSILCYGSIMMVLKQMMISTRKKRSTQASIKLM